MEEELIRKAQTKGIQANFYQVKLTDDELHNFATKAYSIVKEFASLNIQQHPNLGLTEYLVNNIERIFKSKTKSIDKDFSNFVSLFAAHRQSGEIEMYRDFFRYNLNIKACQLFIKYYLEILALTPHLYSNKGKLLQHVKLDAVKAKELASFMLSKEISKSIFGQLFLRYMEDHTHDIHKIKADVVARFLLQSYYYNKISPDENANNEENVILNWNSHSPHVFEIQVVKTDHNDKSQKIEKNLIDDEESPNLIEDINTEYATKDKQERNYQSEYASKKVKTDLPKICHAYVLQGDNDNAYVSKKPQTEEYSRKEDEKLNKELEKLRKELTKRKAEMEMEKSIWKLVLNNSKTAIGNYGKLKKEITITEGLTDALLNITDKDSEEWRHLYEIKNNDIEELYKYKFLIAALLEHCSQDLDKDIEGFRFGHDEHSGKINQIVSKNDQGFDLNDYLTNAYRTNKLLNSYNTGSDAYENGYSRKEDEPSNNNNAIAQAKLINAFKFPSQNEKSDSKFENLNNLKKLDNSHEEELEEQPNKEAPQPMNSIDEVKEKQEKEREEIQNLIENQEVEKLKKHLNKLKRELVFAPKKQVVVEEDLDAKDNLIIGNSKVSGRKRSVKPKGEKATANKDKVPIKSAKVPESRINNSQDKTGKTDKGKTKVGKF